MEKNKTSVTGKELLALGLPEGRVIGIALELINQKSIHLGGFHENVSQLLKSPEQYLNHPEYAPLAEVL
ncbi:MAG: RtcB family protein, partial [Bacteroidota bacterium]